jgi:hypothetical protein
VAGHDEVGAAGVVAEAEPDGGLDAEVGEEEVGHGSDDPGAPVEAVGVGVGAAARGEDGDPGRRRDWEGEVWRASGHAGGERLRADGAAQEHPRRRHGWLGALGFRRERAGRRAEFGSWAGGDLVLTAASDFGGNARAGMVIKSNGLRDWASHPTGQDTVIFSSIFRPSHRTKI